jgi:NRPS condensation-like uncharacterized protein/acyl carrier protein
MQTVNKPDFSIFQSLVDLSSEQRQLFELLLKKQGEDLAQVKIPKRNPDDLIPLSYSQERVWNVAQLTPDSSVDNVPVALHILGDFDIQIFKASILLLVQRNEILRTVCEVRDRQPTQLVLSEMEPQIEVIDLIHIAKQELLGTVVRQSEAIAKQPFNLSQDILFKTTIFHLGTREFVVLLVAHQLVTDGLSFRILLQELAALYKAIQTNTLDTMPAPQVQYADFAIWQRQWFAKSMLEPQVSYWQKQLADVTPQLKLPVYQNCQFPTYDGTDCKIEFSAHHSDLLRSLCREQGVTVFMAFIAIFQIVLRHCTLQNDICIGTLTSNRNRQETEQLIGNFSNNLLLRSRITDNLSFNDLLAQTRETVLDANQNQDVPFQYLLNSVKGLPKFQALLILRNSTTAQSFSVPDLEVSDLSVDLRLTRMELSLDLTDDGKNPIAGKLEYKTELFKPETIDKIVQNFGALLENITADPKQKLADITLPATFDHEHSLLESSSDREQSVPKLNQLSSDATEESQKESQISSGQRSTPPRTKVEREIAAIWEEIFSRSEIGIYDNFFELGGHSLMAIRIVEKIQTAFQIEMALHYLFQTPTIADLATYVDNIKSGSSQPTVRSTEESSQAEKISSILIPIKPSGDRRPFFWINNLQQAQALTKNWDRDRPLYCLDIFGLANDYILTSDRVDIKYIASQFVMAMQSLQPAGPYLLGAHCINTQLAFEVSQQLIGKGEKIAFMGLFDPLDWEPVKAKKDHHWRNFRKFGFNYLFFKLGLYIRGGKDRSKFYALIYPFVQKFFIRHPLFEEELSDEIAIYLAQYYKAVNDYNPKRYSGKIDIFLTGEYASLSISRLRSLAEVGVETHILQPYHVLLFMEKSHMKDMGDQLQARLNESDRS